MIQTPGAVGLFLCESVIVDEQTKNVTPVNCFSQRAVEAFPSELVPFAVFALLTDGMGAGVLELEIQSLDSELFDSIYLLRLPVRFPGPLRTVRCVVRPRGCSFPAAGVYEAVLRADGELIAQRRFRVVLVEDEL